MRSLVQWLRYQGAGENGFAVLKGLVGRIANDSSCHRVFAGRASGGCLRRVPMNRA
jgi:hypothetical protein